MRDPRFANVGRYKTNTRREPARKAKYFRPQDFTYDANAQTAVCPNGKTLTLHGLNTVTKGHCGVTFEGSTESCKDCPLRSQCLRKPDTTDFRQVTFYHGAKTKEAYPHTAAMKARIDTRIGRLTYSHRMGIVEPVFGNLHNHRLRRFTLRSKAKVDAQWKLFALVHNIQKLQSKAV